MNALQFCEMKKVLPSPLHVGELVKKILDSKGIKHKAACEALGVAASNFSFMLRQDVWDIRNITAISDLVGINLFSYFVKGEEYENMVMEDSPVYAAVGLEKQLNTCNALLEAEKTFSKLLKENNEHLKRRNRELEIENNALKSLKT